MTSFGTAPAKSVRRGLSRTSFEVVYVAILLITVGAWTLVGFAVWVPLLVRTTTIMAASVFYATLFRDPARILNAERSLHFAVRFYLRGFEHFLTFYRQRHEFSEAPVGLLEPLSEMKWKELLVECAWVIGVWSLVYLFSHALMAALAPITN